VVVAAAAAVVAAVGFVGNAPAARADATVDTYDVVGTVSADGTLKVTETLTFAAGSHPAQIVQRLDTVRDAGSYSYYKYQISDVTATANGKDLAPVAGQNGDYLVITVDTHNTAVSTIVIGYTVKGAAVSAGTASGGTPLTSISWPVLQGLNLTADTVTGKFQLPGPFTSIDCVAGAPSGPQPCSLWGGGTHDSPDPSFEQKQVTAGDVVIFTVGTTNNVVAVNQDVRQRWTLDRAFSTTTAPLLAALGALVVGAAGLFLLWRQRGRDVSTVAEPTIVASFVPVGKGTVEFQIADHIRPGHVGTVIDEHVDPVDIVATVLDLAVRGHLQIVQLAPTKPHELPDWTFKRLTSTDKMRPFEQRLIDAIAPVDGDAAVVSKISGATQAVMGDVQRDLYEEVVDRGWFSRRPDQTRHLFDTLGWAGIGVAVLALLALVIWTHFGLLGLVLVALAVGFLVLAQAMPRRTASGHALLHGLHALSMSLQTQPTSQVPKTTAYTEISKVLPYAVVLGGRARWVQALADADDDPGVPDPDDLSWYKAPSDWNLSELPVCLDAFIAHLAGRLIGRD